MKPAVMYLDIDDTLLTDNESYWFEVHGEDAWYLMSHSELAAPGAGDFLRWATQHYEVRFLSAKTASGFMDPSVADRLASAFGLEPEFIASIPCCAWGNNKLDGIDFDDPRPWIWIEDGLLSEEKEELKRRGLYDRHLRCNVTQDPYALMRLHQVLMQLDTPGILRGLRF